MTEENKIKKLEKIAEESKEFFNSEEIQNKIADIVSEDYEQENCHEIIKDLERKLYLMRCCENCKNRIKNELKCEFNCGIELTHWVWEYEE